MQEKNVAEDFIANLAKHLGILNSCWKQNVL